MAAVISEVLLEQFSKFVAERIGLHFPRERWRDWYPVYRGQPRCLIKTTDSCSHHNNRSDDDDAE